MGLTGPDQYRRGHRHGTEARESMGKERALRRALAAKPPDDYDRGYVDGAKGLPSQHPTSPSGGPLLRLWGLILGKT